MIDSDVDFNRLGSTIRTFREELDLTQKELEERSGIAHTIISRLETGAITDPKLSTLSRLAQGLNLSLAKFVDEITSKSESYKTIKDQLEVLKDELIERFHVEEVGLFGSVARGETSPDSDVDILVQYRDGHRDIFNHSRLESFLEDQLERSVDLVMRRSEEPEQHSRIQQNIEEDLILV